MTPELWLQADLKRVGEELKDWEATMRHEALLLRDQVTLQGSGDGILAQGLARGSGTGVEGAVHWHDQCLPTAGPCKAWADLHGSEAVVTAHWLVWRLLAAG